MSLEYTKGWQDGYDAASMSGADKRSYPQLKRFMALMQAAFDHWPASNPFKPDDKEHLRAYLIVRAGFMESVSIRVATWNMKPTEKDYLEFVLRSALKAAGAYAFIDIDSGQAIVRRPVSVSYKTPHKVACDIFTAVDELIPIEMPGMTADRLLREAEKAA